MSVIKIDYDYKSQPKPAWVLSSNIKLYIIYLPIYPSIYLSIPNANFLINPPGIQITSEQIEGKGKQEIN